MVRMLRAVQRLAVQITPLGLNCGLPSLNETVNGNRFETTTSLIKPTSPFAAFVVKPTIQGISRVMASPNNFKKMLQSISHLIFSPLLVARKVERTACLQTDN